MMTINLIRVAALAAAVSGVAARAGDMAGGVEFHPAFAPETGLTLAVQNYSKLPKRLDAVDIFIGGDARRAACHVALPAVNLAPAERTSVTVATAAAVGECVGNAPGARAALVATPLLGRIEAAPDRYAAPQIRIAAKVGGATPAPMLFSLGRVVLPKRAPPPVR